MGAATLRRRLIEAERKVTRALDSRAQSMDRALVACRNEVNDLKTSFRRMEDTVSKITQIISDIESEVTMIRDRNRLTTNLVTVSSLLKVQLEKLAVRVDALETPALPPTPRDEDSEKDEPPGLEYEDIVPFGLEQSAPERETRPYSVDPITPPDTERKIDLSKFKSPSESITEPTTASESSGARRKVRVRGPRKISTKTVRRLRGRSTHDKLNQLLESLKD